MAQYDITNYAGDTLYRTESEAKGREWLRVNGVKGDTLWDNVTDEPLVTL